jgi:hypothetical protein
MRVGCLFFSIYLCACSVALAQTGSSGGGTSGASSGSMLSNGSTISGTGGSPGPNTSNALGKGSTGNNLGTSHTPSAGGPAASTGNAVNTPAANRATQSLGNTDAGVLKK